jgi:hypothetical protein
MADPLPGRPVRAGRPWRGSPGVFAGLIVAGLAVQLVPLVVLPTVPTQDGPAHL